ncbi:MAG: RcpC/CpaB family pilus assembly protein [Actinomycetota bacterium]
MNRHHPGRRRLLAAGFAAAATASALHVVAPNPPTGRPVVVAVRAVASGALITGADIEISRRLDALPSTAITDVRQVVGRVATVGLVPDEVITTGRVVNPASVTGDDVLTTIRVANPEAADLLTAGQYVDVLVAVDGATTARTVVRGALVITRPHPTESDLLAMNDQKAGSSPVVLQVSARSAADLAQASQQGPLTTIVRASKAIP